MDNLKVDDEDLDPEVAGSGGGASLPLGVGSTAVASGGAAGLKSVLSGFKAAAMNVLNYTTYYEMKARAGTVGKNGVAKLVDQLAPTVQKIHLVGHSFGGRVIAATAANSTTDKIGTLTLLQTAFSQNGFSKSMNGFFRSVVDQKRVHGPILVTHTPNDTAVGVAYPLASRINGDKTAAFGDKNDIFGGIGRNGAQRMQDGETVGGTLSAVGAHYAFQPGRLFNLEASEFIKSHGDVTGKEVAYAMRRAVT
jgi:pimeloyl-ACP methyl ester carboxylesterase